MADNRKRPGDAIDLTEEGASPQEKKMRASINDAAADLLCPISQELPVDPVIAEDGQIYERGAIVEWLSRNATSPITRAPMGTKLVPAVPVRNTIGSLIKSGAIEGELAEAWTKKLEREKEVNEIRAKAEGGDGYSMWRLGVRYRQGVLGLRENAEQARAWYERSAAVRDPRGMAAFGEALLNGIGGSTDTSLGLVLVTEAATNGSDFGAWVLAKGFFYGNYGLTKDPVRARFWLKKIVDGACECKHLSEETQGAAKDRLAELDAEDAMDAIE